MNRRRPFSILSVALATTLALHVVAAPPKAPAPVEGRALDATPDSRAEAAQAVDAALAAALIGALSTQFGERKVEVRLDRVQTDPVNLIDLGVEGEARVRLGDDDDWLPVRFRGLYDGVAATFAQPQLTIGDDGPGTQLPLSSPIAAALRTESMARLKREFAYQRVDLRLDRVMRREAGKRYARIEGTGAASIDAGAAPFSVHALYDLRTGQWVRVVYELTGNAGRGAPSDLALR
jgi:hypothetical protein